MALTWIVVAHRAGCRLLESLAPGKPLTLVEEIDHPQGRFQNQDVDSDSRHASKDSSGLGRGTYEPQETSHDHIAKVFAADIVKKLEEARNSNYFDAVVLVAEPRFLGMLREQLSSPLEKMVRGSVGKDLYRVPTAEIANHLGDVLRFR